jgi:hypothetical protein
LTRSPARPTTPTFPAQHRRHHGNARQDVEWGSRPLESARWAGAVDNVGGRHPRRLCRKLQPYGNVASCGMAGGHEVHGTVMPHIIRGVSILGIASAGTDIAIRRELWRRLALNGSRAPGRDLHARSGLAELPGVFPECSPAAPSDGRWSKYVTRLCTAARRAYNQPTSVETHGSHPDR